LLTSVVLTCFASQLIAGTTYFKASAANYFEIYVLSIAKGGRIGLGIAERVKLALPQSRQIPLGGDLLSGGYFSDGLVPYPKASMYVSYIT